MCRPIKAHAFTVSTEKQGPKFDQLTEDHRLFLQKEKEELTVRSILLWDIPMRGCCAQTHTVPKMQSCNSSHLLTSIPSLIAWQEGMPINVYQERSPPVLRDVMQAFFQPTSSALSVNSSGLSLMDTSGHTSSTSGPRTSKDLIPSF